MPDPRPETAVLIVNLGTPDSPSVRDVRRYLREFLSDPRVISLAGPLRWLLLEGIILPFRPRRSAEAYAKIWTDEGSPLLVHGRRLATEVSKTIGPEVPVALAMRYGNPSLEAGITSLLERRPSEIVVLPLYPQYASATTGSSIAKVLEILEGVPDCPEIRVVPPFYDHPAFIEASAEVARPRLDAFKPDHVVMSFHGLPEQQVRELDATGRHCLVEDDCCDRIGEANRNCYRAQCVATARALARALALDEAQWSLNFKNGFF